MSQNHTTNSVVTAYPSHESGAVNRTVQCSAAFTSYKEKLGKLRSKAVQTRPDLVLGDTL